jgi:putative transposase
MDVFDGEVDRFLYLELIRKHTIRCGVEILAWCLMTNHVHFIAVPEDQSSLAKAFGEAHRLYTRMKNFRMNARGYLFQGRFNSCVLDERHLVAATRYIEQNPVRAKMVKRPGDYRWSSAAYHLGLVPQDVLVGDRTLMGLAINWPEFLAIGDEDTNQILRSGAAIGRPMGDESFVQRIQEITGRDLRKGKPGKTAMSEES